MVMHARNSLVAAVVYDGLCNFEFSCAAETFGLDRPELGADWYRFETVAGEPGPLRGNFGFSIEPDAGLSRLLEAGTIVVPGWKSVDAPVPPPLVGALRESYARGARLLSVCSGSTVLAATGLLDGKRATTHWMYIEQMRRMYPRVEFDPDVLYIDEGQIITSAGSAAGLDACLHLVRRDYGAAVANHVARRMVIPPHRDGGQAQYIERPVPGPRTDHLSVLLASMHRNLGREQSIPDLARQCAMSERTFMRRFKQRTGMAPAEWMSVARVDRARELLENTRLPIEVIAAECGLGSAANLRHHFRRRLKVSPRDYRNCFGQCRE
jgi:AraC family transcriptional regulator, transcriptional activator FtrA